MNEQPKYEPKNLPEEKVEVLNKMIQDGSTISLPAFNAQVQEILIADIITDKTYEFDKVYIHKGENGNIIIKAKVTIPSINENVPRPSRNMFQMEFNNDGHFIQCVVAENLFSRQDSLDFKDSMYTLFDGENFTSKLPDHSNTETPQYTKEFIKNILKLIIEKIEQTQEFTSLISQENQQGLS